jgi:hypothetical protein
LYAGYKFGTKYKENIDLTDAGAHPDYYPMVSGGFYPGDKAVGA